MISDSALRRLASRSFGVMLASLVSAFLASEARVATAGQGATGSIIGQVTDESSAVLPGVTVSLTSPALQVPQVTTVTDGQGEYRLTSLPIGEYRVEFTLAGFQTVVREGIRLTMGFTAKLDQVLNVGALEESVTVSGASPIVDTVSATTRTELTSEQVDLIPSSRDGVSSFLGQVPGVVQKFDVGGAAFADTTVLRAYGQTGQAWMLLEGVYAVRLGGPDGPGSHYDFNSIEGARVQTIGNSAEMPRRGMMVDLTTKSGGNEFHGEALWGQSHQDLQADNIDDRLRAVGVRGASRVAARYDGSGALGGRIIENKLWFYVAGRKRHSEEETLGAFYADGRPVSRNQTQRFHIEKLSWQMRPEDKLIGFFHWAANDDYNRGGTQFVPFESTDSNNERYKTGKVEWQATRGNSVAVSLQAGRWRTRTDRLGHAPGVPKTRDIRTLFQTGDHVNQGRYHQQLYDHNRGVLTLFQPDLFMGNHEFKIGFDHLYTEWNPVFDNRRSGNYELLFDNGVPFQVNVFNRPVDQRNITNYLGIYAQDAWTIARKLTLNLGLRFARDASHAPEQCRVAGDFGVAECYDKVELNTWNTVAPRAHIAFDVFGTGKAVVKGGWGRFRRMRETQEIEIVNPNVVQTITYRWRDVNADRDFNLGETVLGLSSPDFVSFSEGTRGTVNSDDRAPTVDEFSIGYDQELMANFAVRIGGIYSRQTDGFRVANTAIPYDAYTIPIVNRDPGPDGTVGNADDGDLVTYFDFRPEFRGGANQRNFQINDPNARDTYKTIEVAAVKRLSQNWQFLGSYSATRKTIRFADLLAFNPNAEINTADETWEWIVKMSGSYILPYGIVPSANFQRRSGLGLARQVLFRGGVQVPSIVLNVEPVGSIGLPPVNILDVRLEKRFGLPRGNQIEVRFDVFNALNVNTTTAMTVRAGATYLVPTAVVLPRIAQLSFQYRF